MKSLLKNKNGLVLILAVLHGFCDLICGYKIVGIFGGNLNLDATIIFIVYNSLAFCLQPMMGLIVDRYHHEKEFLGLSAILLISGAFISNWIISIICLGLGNQMFHVSGGKICTNLDTKSSWSLGVFVSLGVIGLTIGSVFYQSKALLNYSVIILGALTIIAYIMDEMSYQEENVSIKKESKSIKSIVGIVFLILVVFIRAFLGKIIHYEFEMNTTLILLLSIGGALGKILGGFLRDKWGSLRIVAISMIVTIITLIIGMKSPVLMTIGIISINISMPISLFELNRVLKGHEGFSFGILAATLFPGVALGMIYNYTYSVYCVFVTISAILTILSIYFVKKVQ